MTGSLSTGVPIIELSTGMYVFMLLLGVVLALWSVAVVTKSAGTGTG
jgi:hypothetical protein